MNSKKYLKINLVVGMLAAVANGGAALMMIGDQSQWPISSIGEAALLASAGFLLIILSGLALAGKLSLASALKGQSNILSALVFVLTLWGMTFFLQKPNQQANISWMIGFLSGLSIYSFYLAKNSFSKDAFASRRPLFLGMCIFAVLVDISVFARVGWF